jgi:peptidyl-prolyl cis-trans isomerase D
MLMPRRLRKASPNWSGKAIIAAVAGVLIIGFGIWGIGEIYRGSRTSATVAKVGRREISVDEFWFLYKERVQQLGLQAGRPMTLDPGQALEVAQQVLSEAVAVAALDERVRELRLGTSDSEVMKRIMTDPAFRGPNGQFDRDTFLRRIREGGYNEQRFVSDQRQNSLRLQVVATVAAELTLPKVAAEAILRYDNEERSIDYVTLDSGKAGDIPAPAPEQLAAYFEQRKSAFRAPEYRKIQLMTASPQDVAATIDVSQEVAKRFYQDRLALYAVPERRQIVQISFVNAVDAKRASERIAAGLAFDDLVKEPGIADRLVDLGTLAKADIIDPAVAKAAFDLASGAVSGPVTGRFGTVMLHVVKIEPSSMRPFDEVEAEIKRSIAADRAKGEMNNIKDKVEEELGGRARFEEIAQKLNLKLRTIEAIDLSGRTPEGEPVSDLPADVDVINPAFKTGIGNENEALQLPGGGFVWYDVVSITPPHERQLDEIKGQVEARFRTDEIIRRINVKTVQLVGNLASGASLGEAAAAEGLTVETKSGLTRQNANKQMPSLAEGLFRTAKDAVGIAQGQNGIDRIIFRVSDIKVPTFDANSATVGRLIDQLKDTYNNDLINQYVRRVENDIGTDVINRNAFAQIVGRATNQSGL